LYENDTVIDTINEKVGFKEFIAKRNRFFLNGYPIFLKGVCRHDLWGHNEGHTMTIEQMEQDMKMIKNTGCNFVRLVHYPHHKNIIKIADKLGLMVSEEPGLWWSDLHNPDTVEQSLEVLKRTIIRDRSNVSIAFWLAFNECELTAEYVKASSETVQNNDPTRMVSGANLMNPAATKELFTSNGFDFYTYHPYGPNPEHVMTGIGGEADGEYMHIDKVLEILDDKPLMFTEWGGYFVIDQRQQLSDFFNFFISASRCTEKGKTLAGFSYWQWNDIYQVSRDCGCTDGILTEGLVDVNRNIKPDLEIFHKKIMEFDVPPVDKYQIQIMGIMEQGNYKPLIINNRLSPEKLKEILTRYTGMPGLNPNNRFNKYRIKHGPVLKEEIYKIGLMDVNIQGSPAALDKGNEPLIIPVDAEIKSLYLIGNTGFGLLYPIGNNDQRDIASCTVTYANGEEYTKTLKNGTDVSQIYGTYGPSRIDPKASQAQRIITFSYNISWEIYHVNLLRIDLPNPGKVKNITLKSLDDKSTLLLYGITVC
jgi:hypothetical protein